MRTGGAVAGGAMRAAAEGKPRRSAATAVERFALRSGDGVARARAKIARAEPRPPFPERRPHAGCGRDRMVALAGVRA